MNTLTFVGKIGKIEYSNFIEIDAVKYFQIFFYEKYNNKVNYFHCYLPKRIFDDFEDFINENTILEVLSHIESAINIKNGKKEIEQRIIIDKINFFELNEDMNDVEVIDFEVFDTGIKNVIDDIPF